MEPRNLEPLGILKLSRTFPWKPWLLGTFTWNLTLNLYLDPLVGTSQPSKTKPCLEPWNLPNLYLEPVYLWTSWILHLQLGTSKLYLEPLLKTFETPGAFIWNPYLEPWNLPKLYLRTFAGNLDRHLEPSRTYTLTWMEPICFTWNLGIFRNLYLEPLLGTSEPSGTLYDWNPYLEPRNLPEPLLGTLILGTSEPSEPYLEPLLGTSEPAGTFTWNPYLEPRSPPEPLLGTLGTSEPAGTFAWNPHLEPRNLPEPLLGTPYLEPRNLPEPGGMTAPECPRA